MSELKFYDDFRKGINDTISPNQLKDNEMFEAENVDLNERGGFSTRKGTVKVNETSLSGKILNQMEWIVGSEERLIILRKKDSDGTLEVGELKNDVFTPTQVVTDENTHFFILKNFFYIIDNLAEKIYEWGAFDFVSTQSTQTIAVGDVVLNKDDKKFYKSKTVSGSVDLSIQTYTDTVKWEDITGIENIVSNECRDINTSDAVDNDMSPIKKCTMFAFHNDSLRVFASGNPENPSALYYSEFNDFGYFKEISIMYPTTNEGRVTAITDFSDVLMVSYPNRWYFWRGVAIDEATWRPLPLNYGCQSYGSLVITPMSLTYLGRNNIHQVDINLVSNQVISMQSYEMINSISEGVIEKLVEGMENKHLAKGVFHEGKYMLFYCDDETLDYNNKVLIYNWKSKGFSVYSNWKTKNVSKVSSGDLLISYQNYVLKTGNGYSDIDVTDGSEVPIPLRIKTKNYYMDSFLNPKSLVRAFLVFQQKEHDDSNVNIVLNGNYVVEDLKTAKLSESLVWGRDWGSLWGWSDMIIKTFFPEATANYFNIELTNNNLNDPITFYALGFEYNLLNPDNESERYREDDLLTVK